jgi:tripartite-type tricarboxylate transporter receptor subunit TctC
MRLRFPVWMLAIGAMAPGAACTQDFPSKPIRFVTAAPGGSSDFTARLIAQGLTDSLRQQVIVKERHFNTGVETVGSTPEELAARIKSEMAKWGKVIRDAGIPRSL